MGISKSAWFILGLVLGYIACSDKTHIRPDTEAFHKVTIEISNRCNPLEECGKGYKSIPMVTHPELLMCIPSYIAAPYHSSPCSDNSDGLSCNSNNNGYWSVNLNNHQIARGYNMNKNSAESDAYTWMEQYRQYMKGKGSMPRTPLEYWKGD
jgi:hypothetical protein